MVQLLHCLGSSGEPEAEESGRSEKGETRAMEERGTSRREGDRAKLKAQEFDFFQAFISILFSLTLTM